ncbi:hypothetical protein EYF80_055831 [Liparis tanakae]|uniref:Uncharacterized protein n=1 Tax=Liparis tanakae TaxID=230148 RepID=A0A4Z2EZ17_9TELE|nr:hypothetical protein EYF80_055831 [Liparis tanakae]
MDRMPTTPMNTAMVAEEKLMTCRDLPAHLSQVEEEAGVLAGFWQERNTMGGASRIKNKTPVTSPRATERTTS